MSEIPCEVLEEISTESSSGGAVNLPFAGQGTLAVTRRTGRTTLNGLYVVALIALCLGLIGCGSGLNAETRPTDRPQLLFPGPGPTATAAGNQMDDPASTTASPQFVTVNASPPDTPTAQSVGKPTPVATLALPQRDLAALIDPIVEKAMQEFGLVGLSLGIRVGPSEPFVKAYGRIDPLRSTSTGSEVIYPIGSITKQFTAAAILQLAEAGKLSLDDSIREFITEAPDGWAGVTIRHLLNHTSGLRDFDADVIVTLERDRAYTVEEVVALIAETAPAPAFAPGSAFEYSSVGYGLLGATIERVSGLPYGEYLRRHIFDPLGLRSSGFQRVLPPDMLQGAVWVADELQPVAPLNPSLTFAAGGVFSTARDLLAWQQALAEGRVLSRGGYASMVAPTVLPDGTVVPYGYGLWVGRAACRNAVDHNGRMPGYESYLLYCPDDDLGLVVLLNSSPAGPEAVESLVARLVLALLNKAP